MVGYFPWDLGSDRITQPFTLKFKVIICHHQWQECKLPWVALETSRFCLRQIYIGGGSGWLGREPYKLWIASLWRVTDSSWFFSSVKDLPFPKAGSLWPPKLKMSCMSLEVEGESPSCDRLKSHFRKLGTLLLETVPDAFTKGHASFGLSE